MENPINTRRLVALAIASLFIAGPGFAKGKDDDGQGKGNKHSQKHEAKGGKGQKQAGKPQREHVKVGAYFNDQHRTQVRQYYTQHYGGGGKACPPGLAKKNNGCMPPGQARKWDVGQPLPAGVIYYPVPQPVLLHLPPVPVGHKYVRVAGDILLVAVGSMMVVDGLNGLLN